MIMGRAQEIISRILETAGFKVEEENEVINLSAFREDAYVVVLCSDDEAEITGFNHTKYRAQLDSGTEECTKILITENTTARHDRCLTWGLDELSEVAGLAAKAWMLGEYLELDLRDDVEHVQAEPCHVHPTEEEPEMGPELPHLALTVSSERALRIAGIKGTVRCRMIPHWHYSFVSTGEKTCNRHVISFESEGQGVLSALNGQKEELEVKCLETGPVPGDAEVFSPKVSGEKVREMIMDEVIRSLTQGVRIRKTEGDTITSEDRIISPDPSDISTDVELFYVPVWQVRGRKIVEINAATGEILSEPMDDGVEMM